MFVTELEYEELTEADYIEAEKNGISRTCLYQRFNYGNLSIAEATTKPMRKYVASGTHTKYLKKAEKNGISSNTYYNRIRRGWGKMRAATEELSPMGRKKENRSD